MTRDPPRPPRLTDRITLWIAAAALALVAVALAVGGGAPSAVRPLQLATLALLLPLALGALLTARAAALLMLRRRPDLHLWGGTWLRGVAAVAVPLLLLAVSIGVREAGPDAAFRIDANLFRCETSTRVDWSASVVSTRGGEDAVRQGVSVDDPSWAGRAGRVSLEGVTDDAYRRAIAEELARCVLPAGTTLAEVVLDAEAPRDRTPLVKHVTAPFSGTVTLQVARNGARRLRWVGTFEGEVELDALGFLAASRVAPEVGARLGAALRERIEGRRSTLEEQLRG